MRRSLACTLLLLAACGGSTATGGGPARSAPAEPSPPKPASEPAPPPSARRALGATATFGDLVEAAAALDGADAGGSDAGCLLRARPGATAGYRLEADLAVAVRPVPSPPADLASRLQDAPGPVALLSRWGQLGPPRPELGVAVLTHMPPPRGPAVVVAATEAGVHLRATAPIADLPEGAIGWDRIANVLAGLPDAGAVVVTAEADLPLGRVRTVLAALNGSATPVALGVALAHRTRLPEPVDPETVRAPLCPDGLPAPPEGTATGGMDAEAAAGTLRALPSETRRCFATFPEAAGGGRLQVRVRVGPDGKVAAACVARDTIGSAGLRACLLDRIRSMRFPAPDPPGLVDLALPVAVDAATQGRQRPLCPAR